MSDLFKLCPRCKLNRNRANFSSNGYCKQCDKLYHAEKRAQQPRKCRQCKELKMPDQYNEPASRSCKDCVQATVERRKALKPKTYAESKDYYYLMGFCPLIQSWLVRKWIA